MCELNVRSILMNLLLIAGSIFPISNCLGQAAEEKTVAQEVKDWRSSMPVSLNGKLPTESTYFEDIPIYVWEDGLQNKVWHNSFIVDDKTRSEWDFSFWFDDQKMQELCKAILDADIPRMSGLIEQESVNVNTVGKHGMTALLVALSANQDPRPFELLLKHKADPNVIVSAPYDDRRGLSFLSYGCSVTYLVSEGTYNRQFKNVFENGGDPNLVSSVKKKPNPSVFPPVFFQLSPDAPDAVERLSLWINLGVNLNFRFGKKGLTFQMLNTGKSEAGNRLVLVALKNGNANHKFYYRVSKSETASQWVGCYFRLIHQLAEVEPKVSRRPAAEQIHFKALVDWLEQNGESMVDAKADLERWAKWNNNEQSDLVEKEHQERLIKERKRKDLNQR